MTRRAFIAGLLSIMFLGKRVLALSPPKLSDETILRGLLDALIPSDDSPGAREARVYEKLQAQLAEDRNKKEFYKTGLSMVRSSIKVTDGKKIDWDAVLLGMYPPLFLLELRHDAMVLFYSDPVGWKTIGYEGPPLIGYSDYHKCGK
jgi:hypothetical protein